MNLDIWLSIISFIITCVSLLMTINNSAKEKYKKNIIEYVFKDFKIVINYFLDLNKSIAKGFSEGLVRGVIDLIKLTSKSLTRFLQYTFSSVLRILRFIFSNSMIDLISKMIYLILFLSTMWTGYFLYMGLINPDDVEYYSGISGMIVSVATMFSILVGFYEFRKKK